MTAHRPSWLRPWLLTLLIAALFVASVTGALLIARQRSQGRVAVSPTPVTTIARFADQAYAHPVSGDFQAYYAANQGAAALGAAISPELPIPTGTEQFFQQGVLQRGSASATPVPADVVRDLIAQGALIPLGGAGSSLTYASLQPATRDAARISPPDGGIPNGDPAQVGVFVPLVYINDQPVGHFIPPAFAAALARLGDWHTVSGDPLTEAIAGTLPVAGATHHILVQAFAHALLWYDQDAPGAPQIQAQPVGLDDLALVGLPAIQIAPGTAIWTSGAPTLVRPAAAPGNAVATFLTPNQIAFTGQQQWQGHDLWYGVTWQNLAETRAGWLDADTLMFHPPAKPQAQIADLAAISPQLAHDVAAYGSTVGLTIYVPDDFRYYVANPDLTFEMASTFKLPILTTLLHEAEEAQRPLTSTEQSWAAAMIERSDNVAEGAMYDEVGQWVPIQQYMTTLGFPDLRVNTDGIGSSLMSPYSLARLVDDLRTHRILTPADCDFVLGLMRHVIATQRMGLGDAAPAGADVALKDGYMIAIDRLWVVHTTGVVTYQGHTYVVALDTRDHTTRDAGIATVNAICHDIAQGLLGAP